MSVVYKEVLVELPWELLYADDMVLMAERETELMEKRTRWKNSMEASMKNLKTEIVTGVENWSQLRNLDFFSVRCVGEK